jgi:glyoxylase-like metal-dependent hydrolase (beta-lactamase superfamily II)
VPLLPFPGKGSLRAASAYFGPRLGAYDWDGITPRAASRTFGDALKLDIGGRRVDLEYVGPAHTPGDSIAHVPDAGVVFAGDIVFNGVTPIIWAGPVSSWIAALERIGELAPDAIVGGHGPIADTGVLTDLIGYWRAIDNGARALRATGVGAGEAARRIVTSDEYAAAPWGSWGNRERTSVNVAMVYRELDDPGSGLSPIDRLRLLFGAAGLAAELESRDQAQT